MKFALFTLAVLVISQTARADHYLKYVMGNSPQINQAVRALEKSRNVVCDTTASIQIKPTGSSSDTWRQVAFCFKDQAALEKGREYLKKGGIGAGAYGLNTIALLDVTYTFVANDDSPSDIPRGAVLNEISLK